MRSPRWPLAATLAALALPLVAQADDIVALNSDYAFFTLGDVSGSTVYNLHFDGQPESFIHTFADGSTQLVTLQEAQTDLGQGQWLLQFSVTADSDLFPAAGEAGYINVGLDSLPLQLLAPVSVASATFRYSLADGTVVIQSDEQAGRTVTPWDGYFTKGEAWGFFNVGGQAITRVDLSINVSAVPEPAQWALLLGGVALLRWRRHSRNTGA